MTRRHSRHAPLCGTHPKARRWLSNDCCGWVCAILTWIFLAFGGYGIYVSILAGWKGIPFSEHNPPSWNGWYHYIGFYGCIFLAYWSHLKTMLTDPGAVPLEALPLDYYNEPPYTGKFQDHHEICRQCDSYKPRIAHHCSICSRCVVRMDHHCVWSNNCIGQTNHKFFIQFCFYVFATVCWGFYLLIGKTVECGRGYQYDENGRYYQSIEYCARTPVGHTLLIVILGVEGFFFGMFTLCMLLDQYTVLNSGINHIEQHKAKKQKKEPLPASTFQEGLVHIFGGDGTFSLWWFIPVDAKWKSPEREFHFMLARGAGDLKHVANGNHSDKLNSDGEQAIHKSESNRINDSTDEDDLA